MSRFNLIDEKWIRVRFPDGSRGELGILETLLRSKDIATIEDPSPLVVASLHRFLLAVLYRALEGPTDIDQAKALFKEGLPAGKITAYLEEWRDRFWLFDEKYPFGQNPNVPEGAQSSWPRLTHEYNPTTNKVLFDHTDTRTTDGRQPKECARWLVSLMTFSIAGGRGYYPSPSSNGMMCIALGRNLSQTLSYNLVPYPNRELMRGDSALWERSPKSLPLDAPKAPVSGYADLYSWQARMILLEDLPSGTVTRIRFVAGPGCDSSPNDADPMQPYKISKAKGKWPVQFRADRAIWRDFDSLLPDSAELAPRTLTNAIQLSGRIGDAIPHSVLVLGLRYEPPNANVDFWRMERFTLPEALAGDHCTRTQIKELLTAAEETQLVLLQACKCFAREILCPGDRKPLDKDVTGFIAQMPVNVNYWSTLESRFHDLLRGYKLDQDPEDIRCQWLRSVRDAMQSAWSEHAASVSTGDAWAIRALVKAEGPIRRKVKDLNEEITRLEPRKEDQ